MAKQTGELKLTGTIGNITFYEMYGEHFARLKSSLSGKRVKKDPRFRRTMEYAGWLAQASGLASCCYGALPKEERVYAMYREMVGMAMQMLKAGKDADVIAVCLEMMFREVEVVPVEVEIPVAEVVLAEVEASVVVEVLAKMEVPAEAELYVDNTGRLVPGTFGNNLITLPPCYFQLFLPEIPENHEKIRGIHPVFFHTYIRRRKFFHGAEYH